MRKAPDFDRADETLEAGQAALSEIVDQDMLERLRARSRNRRIIDALYSDIVDMSRQPVLFIDYGLPDTVMGRYESLGIHVFLSLVRCSNEEALRPVAQDLVDRFMTDIEDSIRQIGIGDVTVPKRMRKLAGMFYERVAAYDPSLRAGDVEGLAAALRRHALEDGGKGDAALSLAAYMIAKRGELDSVASADILGGRLTSKD